MAFKIMFNFSVSLYFKKKKQIVYHAQIRWPKPLASSLLVCELQLVSSFKLSFQQVKFHSSFSFLYILFFFSLLWRVYEAMHMHDSIHIPILLTCVISFSHYPFVFFLLDLWLKTTKIVTKKRCQVFWFLFLIFKRDVGPPTSNYFCFSFQRHSDEYNCIQIY